MKIIYEKPPGKKYRAVCYSDLKIGDLFKIFGVGFVTQKGRTHDTVLCNGDIMPEQTHDCPVIRYPDAILYLGDPVTEMEVG